MSLFYYSPPSDQIFEEVKEAAIEVWQSYGNRYANEQTERIKDLKNIRDNLMFMVSMMDFRNKKKLASKLSAEARYAIAYRIIDGSEIGQTLKNSANRTGEFMVKKLPESAKTFLRPNDNERQRNHIAVTTPEKRDKIKKTPTEVAEKMLNKIGSICDGHSNYEDKVMKVKKVVDNYKNNLRIEND